MIETQEYVWKHDLIVIANHMMPAINLEPRQIVCFTGRERFAIIAILLTNATNFKADSNSRWTGNIELELLIVLWP